MEFLRCKPVGVDAVIDRFQRAIFRDLIANAKWNGYDSYPRVYKNTRGKEVIPEYYGVDGDYTDVRFNDKRTVLSFFMTDDKRTLNDKQTVWTQDIAIIIQARLDKLYSDKSKDRKDERLINDFKNSLRRTAYDKYRMDITTGVDKVYADLKLSNSNYQTDDMNNFAVVRFNISMLYTNTVNPSRI